MSGTDIPSGWWRAVRRGLAGHCPRCGVGRVFAGFVRVADSCEVCGLELSEHRADDLPPYIVIFIVGHVVGLAILETEMRVPDVPLWFHLALWPALALASALALMRPAKGAVVGLQYALGMHGFAAIRRRDLGDRVPGAREAIGDGRAGSDAGAQRGGA